MKLAGVLCLLIAFTCSAGILGEAHQGIAFERHRLRVLERRLAIIKALSRVTASPVVTAKLHTRATTTAPTTPVTPAATTLSSVIVAPVTVAPTTVAPATQKPTPSAGLAVLAAAQGITLADLEALSPADLASLQAAFDAGEFNK